MCSFLLYSCAVYVPGGFVDNFQQLWRGTDVCWGNASCVARLIRFEERWASSWDYDKPWPISYFAWLFDPSETTGFDYRADEEIPKGIDVTIGSLPIKGSGALTGDFGVSWNTDFGRPVVEFFGPGIVETFVFLASLIAALMALVAAQRWRRPQPYRISATPTASALVDWWQLHANSPLDIAVVRRQVG